MARALVRTPTAKEDIKDFQYLSASQILLPASSILIGTANTTQDAILYSAANLTFDFANGTGDNGLDTGTESSNQWYALYAVPNNAGTAFVLKASVNPPPQAGGTGPTGYTKYRYLGIFRNGGNGYDTGAGYGTGDIARFKKVGRNMYWQHFNSDNGGQYPAASGMQGCCIYVANTSTDGNIFDGSNASNFGFNGSGLSGVKVPYRYATYKWQWCINSGGNAYCFVNDSAGNSRRAVPGSLVPGTNRLIADFWQGFSEVDSWVSRFNFLTSSNPNVSRFMGFDAMIDPYLKGDNA